MKEVHQGHLLKAALLSGVQQTKAWPWEMGVQLLPEPETHQDDFGQLGVHRTTSVNYIIWDGN